MKKYLVNILTGVTVLVLGILIANYFNIYSLIPHFDKLLHFLGGFIVAWFFSIFFANDLAGFSRFKRLLILAAMTALIGVFWEFAEYLSNVYSSPLLKHFFFGGSLSDTLTDLLSDIIGGVIFGLFF